MAEELGISRSAVWKHIRNARESGIKIISSPKKGYKIVKFPEDRIIPELVSKYYNSKLPIKIICLDKVTSTNDYAREINLHFKKNNYLVTAEEQTGGRGRFNRKWSSEKGKDLTFTLLLRIDKPVAEFYKFTILSGMAVLLSVKNVLKGKAKAFIKWPNDILIGNRKLCGILSEMITEDMRIITIIIGIGINVNSIPSLANAVSLKNIVMVDTDRNTLLASIISKFNDLLNRYDKGDFPAIFRDWKSNLAWLGKKVSIIDINGHITGKLKDVNENGAVMIETAEGERMFYSGDLILGSIPEKLY